MPLLSVKDLPDEHYWWRRGDFRAFADTSHNFVSEIGYSGAPAAETVKVFCADFAQFDGNNPFLKARDYSTEGDFLYGLSYYFENIPETAEEKILATQIYQAEAYKLLIETTRLDEKRNGLLIWTFNEGWPCFTSGIVDYYGRKKLAFYYVKNAQSPVQMLFCKENGAVNGYVSNNTLREVSCRAEIFDGEGTLVKTCGIVCPPLSCVRTAEGLAAKDFLFSALTAEGQTVYNHIALREKYPFALYRSFLERFSGKLCGGKNK